MSGRRALFVASLAVTLAGVVAACSSSSTEPPEENVVTLNPASFSPAVITIQPGETVRWVNGQTIFHTIKPEGHEEWSRQTMNTQGDVFEHTFQNEGEFEYICEPHAEQGMTGTIRVEAGG